MSNTSPLLIIVSIVRIYPLRRVAVLTRTEILEHLSSRIVLRMTESRDRIPVAAHGTAAHHVVTAKLCECAAEPSLAGRSGCRLCSGDVPCCRSSTSDCTLECACHVAAAELRLSAEQSRDELRDLLDEQQDEKRCEHRLKEQGKILGRVVDKL